jgi:hypothetical protein
MFMKFAKAISLFYGVLIIVSTLSMGVFVAVSGDFLPEDKMLEHLDFKTMFLIVCVPINVTVGLFLLWFGKNNKIGNSGCESQSTVSAEPQEDQPMQPVQPVQSNPNHSSVSNL